MMRTRILAAAEIAKEEGGFSYVSRTGSSPSASASFGSSSTAATLALSGLGGEFVLEDPTQLVEHADGSAALIGWLASTSDPDARWWVDLNLKARRSSDAPKCTPDLALEGDAYVSSGGPVDPSPTYS